MLFRSVPMISLLEKSLGDRTAVLLGERAAADTLILTHETFAVLPTVYQLLSQLYH